MLPRFRSLGWALPLAFVGQGACFQLVGSPFGRVDSGSRWRTTGSRGVRLLHVREAASVVRPDSSESGGSGPAAGGGEHGEEGVRDDGQGASPVLMDFFMRWVDLVLLFSVRAKAKATVFFSV